VFLEAMVASLKAGPTNPASFCPREGKVWEWGRDFFIARSPRTIPPLKWRHTLGN